MGEQVIIDELTVEAMREIKRARALKLPLSEMGKAIFLADAVVAVENASWRLGRRQAAGCETSRDTPRRARRPEAPLALRPVRGSGAALSPPY